MDLAGEGRFDFWISNFKFQKRFLAWGIESRKRPGRCDDAGAGCWVWVKARKGREGAKGRGAKGARKSLGSEKPRRAKGEGLERASHYVPV